MDVERRFYEFRDLEIRSNDRGRTSFRGVVNTFERWSKDLGGFRERMMPSAPERNIREGVDIPFVINHDKNLFLARTGTGTVQHRAMNGALLIEAPDLPDTQAARDLKALGDEIRGMSFGFVVPQGGDSWNWEAMPAERSLLDIDIRDYSVLTGATPAYNDTTAEVRSLLEEHGVWLPAAAERDYSTADRVALAKKGQAIPVTNDKGEIIDGRYPIANVGDLKNAIQAYGRASDKGEVQAWIKKRAAALGATDQIPDDWRLFDDIASLLAETITDVEQRAGAVLSAKSKQRLSDAMQAMREAHGHLETLMNEAGDSPMHASENDVDGVIEDQASLDARLGAARKREEQLFRALHSEYAVPVDTEDRTGDQEPARA